MYDIRGHTAFDQLKWFTDILNSHNLNYWVDSGTLLGLMREGKLLEWDSDIDLGIWEKDALGLRKILQEIARDNTFKVHSYTYNGDLLAFFIIPNDASKFRVINISVFREYGEYAYLHAPRILHEKNLYRYLFKAGRFIFYHFVQRFKSSRPNDSTEGLVLNIEDASWPLRKLADPRGTWWIPSSYFKNLTRTNVQGLNILVPRDWEGYLSFRYGEWRIATKEWSYWIHDRGFQRRFPHELMGMA